MKKETVEKKNVTIADKLLVKSSLDECPDLTDRETEIMKLVWEGYSNIEIGGLLKLSKKTVEAHRSNIMGKYRTTNVIQMIRIALKKGIIKV